MNYTKRLSVIVPGYNTKKDWWVRCIASIDKALTEEDEIIVVDDGSKSIVEREWFASEKVRIIRHEKNLGLPSGRNSGLEAAQGKFMTFVDSDDEVLLGAFDKCIAKLEEYAADVAVYGIRSVYLADKFQILDMPERGFYGALTPSQVAALVKKRLFYYSCNKVFRRAFIDEHSMRFNSEGVPQEDAIFNVGLVVNKAKWVGVDVEGYRYYRYDGSIVSRFMPTYEQGTRACTKAWRDYKATTPGAVEEMEKFGLGWYDETSDEQIARNQWMNIWRKNTPYGLAARWHWLRDRGKDFGCIGIKACIIAYLKQVVRMGVRRYLYIAPLRRHHQKAFLSRIGAKIFPLEEGLAKRPRYEMIMNIPAPYRLPLFREMHKQMTERGVDFTVHFMNQGHKDRPKSWLNPEIGVPHKYWMNIGPDQHELNPGLVLKMIFNPPEYLDLGSPYDTFTCILLAFLSRAKCKIMGMEGNTKTPGKMTGFIGWFKRAVISQSDYAPISGSDGAKWLDLHRKAHGIGKYFPKTTYLPNVIEESRFHVRGEYATAEMHELRTSALGADDETRVCLIPARFDPVKGLKEFFKIVEPSMLKGWKLVIMGHGPEEEITMKIVNERGLSDYVKVIHSVPYDEMPRHYAAADLMLLPSLQDMNPLSVIEALHSGLPLALSCMAGNVEEAVTEGENGWVLPVMDEELYCKKLAEVFATPIERLREMGKTSKQVNARYWITSEAVTRFLDSIKLGVD